MPGMWSGDMAPLASMIYARNQQYLRPFAGPFSTALSPADEAAFRQWVAANNVPFDINAMGPTDYDMRGFYQGLMTGNPNATTAANPTDLRMHYSDYWKTPYHQSFSAESQWANPATAPRWNTVGQLVLPDGTIVFDERIARLR